MSEIKELPTSEFTKECRALIRKGVADNEWEFATKLREACDIIERRRDKMNKSGLIAHFQEQKRIAEKEIAFWQAQPDAEEPKRRHGDFGYTDDGYVRIAIKCREKNDLMQLGHISMPVDGCENEMNTVLGNIFDLMKDWGEDLEEFEMKAPATNVVVKQRPTFIAFFDGSDRNEINVSNEKIEEFWCKLGQMIMTLKRKQAL